MQKSPEELKQILQSNECQAMNYYVDGRLVVTRVDTKQVLFQAKKDTDPNFKQFLDVASEYAYIFKSEPHDPIQQVIDRL